MPDRPKAEHLARRIVCRALDIDPEMPSEAIETIFAPGNVCGEFAVQEAEQALAETEQRGAESGRGGEGWVSVEEPGAFDLLQDSDDGAPFWVVVSGVVQEVPWLRDEKYSAWRVDGELVTVPVSHFQPVLPPAPPESR